jgi:hypothetical protein
MQSITFDIRAEANRRGVWEVLEGKLETCEKFTFEDLTVSPFDAEVHDLANEWLRAQVDTTFDFLVDIRTRMLRGKATTPAQAKGVLNCLLAEMRKARKELADLKEGKVAVTEPGIYSRDGVVYKVQLTKDKQRLYAKALVALTDYQGDRLNENDERVRWTWEYANGTVYALDASDRMTEADARDFGLRFGICANCGKRLTVADSVEKGIGPVCIQKFRF